MRGQTSSYYEELGVQPDATQEKIRDAFRRLAKQYHPDLNRGDRKAEERFKRINEAYRVLSDPVQRLAQQEKELVREKARQAARRSSAASSATGTGFTDVFRKVFKTGFGTAGTAATDEKGGRQPGKDLQITLDLDPIELARGVKKKLRIKRDRICDVCGGTGMKAGTQASQCSICLGIGEVPVSKDSKTVFVTCSNCRGTGSVIRHRCMNCAGRGVARGDAQVVIDIPSGSRPGITLTIPGQGHAGPGGGSPGVLMVQLAEKESSYFEARGTDIVYEYPLTIRELVNGGEVEIPTPDGRVKLTLPPGLVPGKVLKVKGKGLPTKDGGNGDLLVRVRYHLPTVISPRATALLDELSALPGWSPERDEEGFVKRHPESE